VERVFVCVTSKGYPERSIFSNENGTQLRILQELRRVVERAGNGGSAAQRALRKELPGLLERFNRVEDVDKLTRAKTKANEAYSAVHTLLVKATERDFLLEDIEGKSKKLEVSAKTFSDDSSTMKGRACFSLWRVRIFAVFAVLVVAAAIVGFIKLAGVW